ncbi:hypothetical protein [Hoylesella buccalis]|uniref:Uncharacterized protein n=1 Tax=Hoylesella buccalis DNF00853 TaxID=1401074 RepID=A0A096BNL5_9BACT|nr:hypothetical protein [Hoylesella buccalis]KGF34759.1 hypothetical protein HMPREF2137_06220 [Hoylesella buccalis DNF00853]
MKKKYEKPVTEVIRIDDAMQMICGSGPGFNNQTSFNIDKWGEQEETNADGTSEEINDFPDWAK